MGRKIFLVFKTSKAGLLGFEALTHHLMILLNTNYNFDPIVRYGSIVSITNEQVRATLGGSGPLGSNRAMESLL